MNRRKALSSLSLLGVSGMVLPSVSLTGCQVPGYQARFFQQKDLVLLDEIGETILPSTEDSPGAKAAFVGNCIDTYVADVYSPKQQAVMTHGLTRFQELCQERYGVSFLRLNPEEKKAFLMDQVKYAQQRDQSLRPGESRHYFSYLKNLVLFSYFTSEVGGYPGLALCPYTGEI